MLRREEGVVAAIRRMKESAAAILEKLAERFHVPPDDALIDTIASGMDPETRERFMRVLHELSSSAREIASHDSLRARLVETPVGISGDAASPPVKTRPKRSVRRSRRTRRRTGTFSGQPA